MSNLVDHAETELAVLGMGKDADDEMNKLMHDHIIELVTVFSKQGHSGFSAGYTANVLHKLLQFEPLAPITGEDSEWVDVGEGLQQNKRCSHVFKNKDGAYDIEGIVFRDPDGSTWTNKDSHVKIEFPYTPKRDYVDRSEADATAND